MREERTQTGGKNKEERHSLRGRDNTSSKARGALGIHGAGDDENVAFRPAQQGPLLVAPAADLHFFTHGAGVAWDSAGD